MKKEKHNSALFEATAITGVWWLVGSFKASAWTRDTHLGILLVWVLSSLASSLSSSHPWVPAFPLGSVLVLQARMEVQPWVPSVPWVGDLQDLQVLHLEQG